MMMEAWQHSSPPLLRENVIDLKWVEESLMKREKESHYSNKYAASFQHRRRMPDVMTNDQNVLDDRCSILQPPSIQFDNHPKQMLPVYDDAGANA